MSGQLSSSRSRSGLASNPQALQALRLLLVGTIYFVLAKLGLQLASINPSATPIWPPTGFAIAAVILWGYRVTPAVFVAAFIVNLITAGSIFTSTSIALGNILEAITAAYLTNRWGGGTQVFSTPTGVAKFAVFSAASTLISATMGAGSLTWAGYAAAHELAFVWLTWWLGDLAGALVVAPVIVLWIQSAAPDRKNAMITGLTLFAAVAVGIVAFSPLIPQMWVRNPLGFLSILPLLWAGLYLGPRDTATVAFILCLFAIWGTEENVGPFAGSTLNDLFLLLLMFMISTAVPSLALSTEVAEQQRARDQEHLLLSELSHRVGNTLAVLQSVFRRSVQHASSMKELELAFEGRLMNLAATHKLLSESTWHSARVRDLVHAAVQPYCAEDLSDCRFSGDNIRVPASMVLSLTMVLHELATNAAKHGAFREKSGLLTVSWHQDESPPETKLLRLNWREIGRPHSERKSSGYGTTLIDTTLAAWGGTIEREFSESGLWVRLSIPLDRHHALANRPADQA